MKQRSRILITMAHLITKLRFIFHRNSWKIVSGFISIFFKAENHEGFLFPSIIVRKFKNAVIKENNVTNIYAPIIF